MQNKNLIIYHASCPDGWTAAYISKLKYPEAELMGCNHGLEPPYDAVVEKDVLVVDFSWRTKEQNRKMASLAQSFDILDHHRSAESELHGEPYAIFDMNRSGAGLAWDYLFGKDNPDVIRCQIFKDDKPTGEFLTSDYPDRPWYVDYVEDRDLWRFKLPNSIEVNDYIMTHEYTIEAWKKMTETNLLYAISAGENIRLQIDKYVREAVKQAQRGNLTFGTKTYSVLVVNVPYLNTSEVGNELSKSADIGIGWFERADGMMQFSLRSKGEIDVSEVAKAFNGGGHQNAAGFQLPLDKGRQIIDTILGRL